MLSPVFSNLLPLKLWFSILNVTVVFNNCKYFVYISILKIFRLDVPSVLLLSVFGDYYFRNCVEGQVLFTSLVLLLLIFVLDF